jgi:hypothetical protein
MLRINIWLIWTRSEKNLLKNGAVYPSYGAHLEHISHEYVYDFFALQKGQD